MFCIGLTGTIASGKSTVAKIFSQLGIDVISADAISQSITQKPSAALNKIAEHFGMEILDTKGELIRNLLRQRIMQDEKERKWLEQLLHPLIRARIKQQAVASKTPYCIIEIPLLNNKTNFPYLNRIILVTATPEQQMSRIMARDNCSYNQAQIILATQEKNNNRHQIADDIIDNNDTIDNLQKIIHKLHNSYLALASNKPRHA